ncbi:MAG: hypothetical protein M3040_10175 [Bacteroidota bacterium]|nr:hypothetical protein [Bacteroidota bacterium]
MNYLGTITINCSPKRISCNMEMMNKPGKIFHIPSPLATGNNKDLVWLYQDAFASYLTAAFFKW